jgi:hypothetical protein
MRRPIHWEFSLLRIFISDDNNTRIIVDDIVSWADSFQHSLMYMRCQLIVCCAYRLSLNLGKSHFFPRRFEFIGIDVCPKGNRPAKSKHQLLETWPAPQLVRDVAKFLGFVQFYSSFIPNFEIRVEALRTVKKQEYTGWSTLYTGNSSSMGGLERIYLSRPMHPTL